MYEELVLDTDVESSEHLTRLDDQQKVLVEEGSDISRQTMGNLKEPLKIVM